MYKGLKSTNVTQRIYRGEIFNFVNALARNYAFQLKNAEFAMSFHNSVLYSALTYSGTRRLTLAIHARIPDYHVPWLAGYTLA